MEFKKAMQAQFTEMAKGELFVTDVSKDLLWETYLTSFPEGTNEIFRERREHDCQCCKQFIRACGNVVAIVDLQLVSIWDIEVDSHFQVVADVMSKLVKRKKIESIFRHYQSTLGTNFNHQMLDDVKKKIIKWEHFYFKLPQKFVKKQDDIGSLLSKAKSNKDVFKRGLEEITEDSMDIVLELIDQDSLYRGSEHRPAITSFAALKKEGYINLDTLNEVDKYTWLNAGKPGARIRNTAIGTLLIDISEGMDLTKAIGRFESKVAPENYKRPTAVVTKGMIKNAQNQVEELGILDSLSRRYAIAEDITINNVLFADRQTKKVMGNVFDELSNYAPIKTKTKKLGKIEDVSINKFIKDILPNITTMEIKAENNHLNNFMSLIAPQEKMSRQIFKWGNNFSWAYKGAVTDSIKERVKRAGGNVSGILRCSLSWYNYDDLDIHVNEPDGNHIYYNNKQSRTSGNLDVDMNAGGHRSREAVENIVWIKKASMLEGLYEIYIRQFHQREDKDFGFEVEMEFEGKTTTFQYDKRVKGNVPVATFEYSKRQGIKFIKSMKSTMSVKENWGIKTQQFHKVKMIMNSPNHWDGEQTGNKHYFFILENCLNPETSRGFFNEFLNEQLNEHRKVFEILGSKMQTEKSTNQLSGLGFSSTKRNSLTCKLTGNFTRTININF